MSYKFFCCFLFLGFFSQGFSQRLMEIKLKNTAGDSVALSSLGGKKILIVVLPAASNHELYGQLDSFLIKYPENVAVVGVFTADQSAPNSVKSAVKNAFSNRSILLVDDLPVKKDSTQSALFRWLSSSDLNGHYNLENCHVGDKYFVDEHGRLYAVFPAPVKLTAPIIDKVMETRVMN